MLKVANRQYKFHRDSQNLHTCKISTTQTPAKFKTPQNSHACKNSITKLLNSQRRRFSRLFRPSKCKYDTFRLSAKFKTSGKPPNLHCRHFICRWCWFSGAPWTQECPCFLVVSDGLQQLQGVPAPLTLCLHSSHQTVNCVLLKTSSLPTLHAHVKPRINVVLSSTAVFVFPFVYQDLAS